MRWILALIGAVLGSVVAEEEGLLGGLFVGGLIGWLVEREQKRLKALAGRPSSAVTPGVQTFEQRASARIIELTKRVEQLEHAVVALQQGGASAVAPSAVVPTTVPDAGPAAPSESAAALSLAQATSEVMAANTSSQADAPSAVPTPVQTTPGVPAGYGRTRDDWAQQDQDARDPRQRAVDEARARSADGRVDLDEFGWPRDDDASHDTRPAATAAILGGADAARGAGVSPAAPSPVVEAIRSFFFGGNTVVRVGVLVLTVGVGLLVKYAADQAYFPLELRLAFAAAIGFALVVLGFRQRAVRPAFATALQGGGVAAMYLVTFFAYYAYQLLPGSLTMVLLIAIAAFSSILAVREDAQQLAVFGAVGGFLSPVLASSGGGSHVALFSYYALLNAAISGMAVFRSWRVLHWVGFAFTFGVASAWGALEYEPANMASASLFLGLFFAFYVLNGTLFALRQPAERRGTIDTTLTFGTPLATLALAGGLFRLEHLYLALACALIAAVYLGVAAWLKSRNDAALAALVQTYVAVGIGVGTLAIPFALDDALATALAWAAEASGLIWVGIKQQRLRTRIGSYVLFAASLFALAARQDEASALGGTLFGALIALALAFASASIERQRTSLRSAEPVIGHVLFALAIVVWTGACDALIATVPTELRDASWFGALALTTLLLELVGQRVSFGAARSVASFAFPVLLLALVPLSFSAAHPLADARWLSIPACIAASYWVLRRRDDALSVRPTLRDALHASAAYTLSLVCFGEARYLTEDAFLLTTGWVDAACLLAPVPVVVLALAGVPTWPFSAHANAYRRLSAWPLALLMNATAVLCQLTRDGRAAPLPYLPLLNPLDLAQAILLVALLLLARTPEVSSPTTRRAALWLTAALAFVALNGTVVRTAHHWADVPFTPWQVPTAPLVQSAFSIMWTVLSLLAMLIANRRKRREVWVAGAVLLSAVVLKLFFVDLSQLGGVAKIVTFLAVGVLLLLIGFVAPVPPARGAAEEKA